ncbi:TPA: hypothetical protein ACIDZU_005169, partial [Pseudomonas aeruginosa]
IHSFPDRLVNVFARSENARNGIRAGFDACAWPKQQINAVERSEMETIMLVQEGGAYEIPYVPPSLAVIDDRMRVDQSRLPSGFRQQ